MIGDTADPRRPPSPLWGDDRTMIVVHDYRGHRTEAEAVRADERWNAVVRIRRILSSDKLHVDTVTRFKLTAEHGERAGDVWAKRWIDVKEGR